MKKKFQSSKYIVFSMIEKRMKKTRDCEAIKKNDENEKKKKKI